MCEFDRTNTVHLNAYRTARSRLGPSVRVADYTLLYKGKDRTFFFFNYEGFRIRQAQTSISTVPSTAWRGGDFSGGPALFDPQTVHPVDRSEPGQGLCAYTYDITARPVG